MVNHRAYVVSGLFAILLLSFVIVADSEPGLPSPVYLETECVVLLHGLARSSRSMRKLEKELVNRGYTVVNPDYPSTKFPVEHLAEHYLHKTLQTACIGQTVHFVTHSMGGILLRYYLTQHTVPGLGRVVMLSPLNQGSEVVDRLGGLFLFKWLNGPAGGQLGTGPDSLPKRLGPVDFELGVITGNRTINPILSMLIPGDDDGKVGIENARVEGMRAFKVVSSSHPLIMRNKNVIADILFFLKTGSFKE